MEINELDIIIDGYLDMLNNSNKNEKQEILDELKKLSILKNFKVETESNMNMLQRSIDYYKLNVNEMSIENKVNWIVNTGNSLGNHLKDYATKLLEFANKNIE